MSATELRRWLRRWLRRRSRRHCDAAQWCRHSRLVSGDCWKQSRKLNERQGSTAVVDDWMGDGQTALTALTAGLSSWMSAFVAPMRGDDGIFRFSCVTLRRRAVQSVAKRRRCDCRRQGCRCMLPPGAQDLVRLDLSISSSDTPLTHEVLRHFSASSRHRPTPRQRSRNFRDDKKTILTHMIDVMDFH